MKRLQTKISLKEKRALAYNMYVNQGMTGTQICKVIQVTEATFSKWVKQQNWKNSKKVKAKYLITQAGHAPVQVSAKLNIALSRIEQWMQENWIDIPVSEQLPMIVKIGIDPIKNKRKASAKQVREVNRLFIVLGLTGEEVAGVRYAQINNLSYSFAEYLLYVLSDQAKPAIELTINQVLK
ncbi:MAG: hypothetical protein WKF68_02505 [Daejeonella sp.]